MTADHAFMARALRLAARGLYTTDPNPRVGCVLVKDGQVVGEGWHRRAGGPHAEIEALRAAGEAARGATAYVSLEPCSHHGRTPPCADALIEAGVARVVAALEDPNPQVAGQGLARLAAAGIRTACGLLEAEAAEINRGFIRRMHTGRPWVTAKLAMSLDGRTALAHGESKWITGDASRRDVHRLRARSSAILTGVATVLADDPALTARLEGEDILQPLRVVLDSRLRIPANAQLVRQEGDTLILTVSDAAVWCKALEARGFQVVRLPDDGAGRVSLPAVLDELGRRGINEVMVEAGPVLNGALLQAGLVDEWVVYVSPAVLGDTARGLFNLPPLAGMEERFRLEWRDVRRVGADLRLRLGKAERADRP